MTSPAGTLSMRTVRRLSGASKLTAIGLVVAAAGMLLQIASEATLYPSVAGPVVLLGTAVLVTFGPRRWTAYVALAVSLLLGVGAIIAAVMTGDFVDQLSNIDQAGIFIGSLLHVVGLIAAVTGGIGMVLRQTREGDHRER